MTQYRRVLVSVSPISSSHTAAAAMSLAIVSSDFTPWSLQNNTEPGRLMVAQPHPPFNMQPQNNIFGNLEMPSMGGLAVLQTHI